MFKEMSVAKRLGSAFAIVTSITMAVAVAGYWGIGNMTELADEIAATEGALAAHASDLSIGVLQLRRFEKDSFLAVGDPQHYRAYVEKWREAFRSANELWRRLERDVTDEAERAELIAQRPNLAVYEAGYREVLAAIDSGAVTTPLEANRMLTPHKDVIRDLEEFTTRIADRHRDRMRATVPQVAETGQKTRLLLGVFVLIGVVVSLFITFLTSRALTVPLTELADLARRLGAGKLDANVQPSDRRDEIGALINAFRDMVTGMRSLVGSLSTGTVSLSTSISEIAATAKQYATTISQQASSVAEVSTTVEEIRQASQTAASSARDVANGSDAAARTGQQGREKVGQATDTMRVLGERVSVIAGQIVQLAERTAAIGGIVDAVNDLAEQSNLLAVNASIEAAKAGEQGRGFAVVAAEVRNLAEQSKRATQQIRTILAEVQRATQGAVMATEEGTKRAEDGRFALEAAQTVIEELALALEDSASKARQIAGAASQQAAGISQMATALETVSQSGRDSASGVKQLERAVIDLSGLSNELKGASSRFLV